MFEKCMSHHGSCALRKSSQRYLCIVHVLPKLSTMSKLTIDRAKRKNHVRSSLHIAVSFDLMLVNMGLSNEAQTALIGLGIGSGALALVALCCWVAFTRLCNASSTSNTRAKSSLSDAKPPSKQLNATPPSPKPNSPTEKNIDTNRLPPPPPPSSPARPRPLPLPPPHATTRTLEERVSIRASSSPRRKQQKSEVHISHNENRPTETKSWRTLASSFATHFRAKKSRAKKKSNPPANDTDHDPSSRNLSHGDPFELYDAEYGAVFLRNLATDGASRLARCKQKAHQTLLEVENASTDDCDNNGTSSSVVANPCSPSFNYKDGGKAATNEAPHDTSPVFADFLGGSSPWAWLTCYASPPLQVHS
jgi:hypothetical protein